MPFQLVTSGVVAVGVDSHFTCNYYTVEYCRSLSCFFSKTSLAHWVFCVGWRISYASLPSYCNLEAILKTQSSDINGHEITDCTLTIIDMSTRDPGSAQNICCKHCSTSTTRATSSCTTAAAEQIKWKRRKGRLDRLERSEKWQKW